MPRFLAIALILLPPASAPLVAVQPPSPDPEPPVRLLVPGFEVDELPVSLSNQNNLRFAPDGTLASLGYDGRIWRIRDTDGDGLEDQARPFWDRATLSVPLGMAWSTHGLLVSSKGKVSLFKDLDGDGAAELEEVLASGWPPTDVGSGGVDATGVTLDAEGNVYFGLLVADYSNAYRLRRRRDLRPDDVAWLKRVNRWRDAEGPGADEDEFSLYDLGSPRGTLQKWSPANRTHVAIASGIRVPPALAFNAAGDLFATDQEGETWMPDGNPLDELNHIRPGQHYGFPPAHPRWLPGVTSEPPVVSFGPQHQSACGLVFNEPHAALNLRRTGQDPGRFLPSAPARARFGPTNWLGSAFVAGQSRGKIFRVDLRKTPGGYVGTHHVIARTRLLVVDLTISPRGHLYLCCHSGPPDWGTGPNGPGRLFRIRPALRGPRVPHLISAWPAAPGEVRIEFDHRLHPSVTRAIPGPGAVIEFGEYVTAGDRFEVLKPPYDVVRQQDATARGRMAIRAARLERDGRTLVLVTDPHPLAVRYAVTLPGIRGPDDPRPGHVVDFDYDLTRAYQPVPLDVAHLNPVIWRQPVDWAPRARASSDTTSRATAKPDGNRARGRELFLGPEFQCGRCHRVRGEGGATGPDLGNLVHRDAASVLRDIREPNATLHPDYVTFQAVLRNGDMHQGFVRAQDAEVLVLFDAEGRETRLARADLVTLRPTDLSLMPAGLLDGRTDSDIRDLLTFLLVPPPN